MKKLVLAAIFTALALPACAMTLRVIPPSQTRQRQGDWIAVGGLARIRPDLQMQGMDVDLVDPDGRILFIGFIPKLNETQFQNLAAFDGRQVILDGVVELYRAWPAMQLLETNQLRLAS